MSKRPIIGITRPQKKRLNVPYMALWCAIWLGGGRTLVLSKDRDVSRKTINGLMLGGGTDVFPGLFNKDPKHDYVYDHPRDEIEIKWLKHAEEEDLPVFAICRGAQLMNVIRNGNLHMDISKVYEGANYPDNAIGYALFRKKITIEEGSMLYKIFQTKEMMVNSIHKQSIDRLGDDLVVSAREPNGIIQGIEDPAKMFYVGVQFHPELLIYRSSFRSFFRKFIGAAKINLRNS